MLELSSSNPPLHHRRQVMVLHLLCLTFLLQIYMISETQSKRNYLQHFYQYVPLEFCQQLNVAVVVVVIIIIIVAVIIFSSYCYSFSIMNEFE